MDFEVELRVHVRVEDVSIAEAVVDTIRLDESTLTQIQHVHSYLPMPLMPLYRIEECRAVDIEMKVACWHINKRIFKDGRYIMWVSPENIHARGLLQEKVVKQLKKDVEEDTFMQWIFEED